MKKLLLSGLVGFAFIMFGITASNASDFKSGMLVASMDKCGSSKCGGEKKSKFGSSKCGGEKKSKCGSSKCGGEMNQKCKSGKCDMKDGKKCESGKCDMKEGKKKMKCGGNKCGK